MLHFILIIFGAFLLARGVKRIGKGNNMPPSEVSLLTWGIVTFFAGVDFVRYYPVSTLGVSSVLGAILATIVISRRMTRSVPASSPRIGEPVLLPHWILSAAKVAAVLVLLGLVGRVYHTGIVNNRGLTLDIGERYLAGREESQRSVGAVLAWLTGFWPLPMGVVVLFFKQLSPWSRSLLLFAGLGNALNIYYLGGRSGIGLTAMSFVGLYLMMLRVIGLKTGKGHFARLALLAAIALVITTLMAYLFERRFRVALDHHRYSQVMDLNPQYVGVVQLIEKLGIAEAVIGTVGYLGSPVQQWSMYLELGLDARLGGAFNFDLPALILRKIGIGETHYAINMTETMDAYENVANVPLGTFSTLLRDLHLDFGWLGILFGVPLFCYVGDLAYYRVVYGHRLEFIPVAALWFGLMGFNPITSGLQIAGANQALLAAAVSWWIIRYLSRRQQVRRRPLGVAPSNLGGAGAPAMPVQPSNP